MEKKVMIGMEYEVVAPVKGLEVGMKFKAMYYGALYLQFKDNEELHGFKLKNMVKAISEGKVEIRCERCHDSGPSCDYCCTERVHMPNGWIVITSREAVKSNDSNYLAIT